MTTLSELGVTPAKLRSYGQDGKFEALTGEQLQGICCWTKAQLDKKEGKFKRWSKSVAKEMRGIGISQDMRSGEPSINYRKAKVVENISVSLEDFNRVGDELAKANEMIQKLMDESAKNVEPMRLKAEELIQANIDNAKPKRTRRSKEQIKADKLKEAK